MNRRALSELSVVADRKSETQTIAARARELWMSCGEPVVRDDAIWQEAERELWNECRSRPSTPRDHLRLS